MIDLYSCIGLFLLLFLCVLLRKQQKEAKLVEGYKKKICALDEYERINEEMLALSLDSNVSDDYFFQKVEPYFEVDAWPFDSVPVAVLPQSCFWQIYENQCGSRHMMTRELLVSMLKGIQVSIHEIRLFLQNKISK